jgi:hypothetical protein
MGVPVFAGRPEIAANIPPGSPKSIQFAATEAPQQLSKIDFAAQASQKRLRFFLGLSNSVSRFKLLLES